MSCALASSLKDSKTQRVKDSKTPPRDEGEQEACAVTMSFATLHGIDLSCRERA